MSCFLQRMANELPLCWTSELSKSLEAGFHHAFSQQGAYREQHCRAVLPSEKLVYCLANGKMSRHSWTNHLPGTQQRHMDCSLCEGWTVFLLLCKGEELLKGFRNAFLCLLLVSSLACNFLRENEKWCYKCCFSLLPNWNRTLDVSLHMKNNRYGNFEK